MADINLPRHFREKINEDQYLSGIVDTTVTEFGEILKENKLYFFPEFTDHGISHVESLLSTSYDLITEVTFKETLGARDIGFYVLAVVLHDLGMHISADGFNSILNGSLDHVRNPDIDQFTWKELWQEYLIEAKKFSGKKLRLLLGDEDAIVQVPEVVNDGTLNGQDRRLIGEFVRRHHPRLAHEIALGGFPASDNQVLPFAAKLDRPELDVIGLIARSHGMELRDAVDILQTDFPDLYRNPEECYAIFLMVLLRIGDYTQVDRSRSSKITLKTRTLLSPVSVQEHQSHLDVRQIDFGHHNDPEQIFVRSSPSDSSMYLKISRLIQEIQYELDRSWAVLGEIYGKEEYVLKIQFRRINSNLGRKATIKKLGYVAESISFRANDELIKLLIAPLYGKDPKYGVRELVQNSIDACLEKTTMLEDLPGSSTPEISVDVYEDGGQHFFRIKDNGVGMNINTIRNYFLSAGASYRNSHEWEMKFLDNSGAPIVRRNGRFGIGVLAAFLLGNTVHVKTSAEDSEFGYEFTAGLNFDQVNIVKTTVAGSGTTITITLTDEVVQYFERSAKKVESYYRVSDVLWFEWYTMESPKITYTLFGKEMTSYKKRNPQADSLPSDWSWFQSPPYDKVTWTYSHEYSRFRFTCNGIVIPDASREIEQGLVSLFKLPKIAVFDKNGYLPVSLNRNSLNNTPSFVNDLIEDQCKDFLAFLLTSKVATRIEERSLVSSDDFCISYKGIAAAQEDFFQYGERMYKERSNLRQLLTQICYSKKGFVPDYNFFIKKIGPVKGIYFHLDVAQELVYLPINIEDRYVKFSRRAKTGGHVSYYKAILPHQLHPDFSQQKVETFEIEKMRFIISSEKLSFLLQKRKKMEIPNYIKKNSKVSEIISGWSMLETLDPGESLFTPEVLTLIEYSGIHCIRENIISCNNDGYEILDKVLENFLGDDPVIPYKLSDRAIKFPKAFEELRDKMRKYT